MTLTIRKVIVNVERFTKGLPLIEVTGFAVAILREAGHTKTGRPNYD
jgi:hypothetical protein